MAQEGSKPGGPDLARGVAPAQFTDGKLLGHVGDQEVLLVQAGAKVFAVGAQCSHYHAPLADGLVVGESIRCPWHHACFDLRSGEATRAPAFDPLSCWRVEQQDGTVFVHEKLEQPKKALTATRAPPERIVIVGAGAAGSAAAEMLRREGYLGQITMFGKEASAPVDRPNLSKDYLAGSAPEEWVPLRPPSFYDEAGIDLRLDAEVQSIDVAAREVVAAGGVRVAYDRLLLATGAEPVRLSIPGAGLPHVHVLRSLADSRAIIDAAKSAKRAVVIGASFIGLETAASLRIRGIEVHVVAPGALPLERVFGAQLGGFVRSLHEQHGVIFHLEDAVLSIDSRHASLKSGQQIEADLVVAGIGVRPRLTLAERAGLKLDRGIAVNGRLETSVAGIYAAGDIARWPDPHSGSNIRVEHWVVAERQGQVAARNMLGASETFADVPFFWSQHYDVPINYVGHAEHWDMIEVEGNVEAKDCLLRYRQGGRIVAVASIFRDLDNLRAEAAMEQS